ncbi:MAG: methionyl-tRNA formyltransferase [Paraglaciecola sp.]|jgi:methionyl-tRNA formyltransferase
MNITILANRDIASNYALNMLVGGLAGHCLTVFLSARVGGNGEKPPELKRLALYEQALLEAIYTDHQCNGASMPPLQPALRCRSFAQLATLTTGPIVELNNINSAPGVAAIQANQPDLILSIRYGVILQPQVISLPKYGVLNLHSGVLPDYRGVMASFWAMLNDEPQLGTTLHYISDKGIDTGEVVATTKMAVDKSSCYLAQVLKLYVGGCEKMLFTVNAIDQGQVLRGIPQPLGGNYYSFPDQQAVNAFQSQGLCLINEVEMRTFMGRHYY